MAAQLLCGTLAVLIFRSTAYAETFPPDASREEYFSQRIENDPTSARAYNNRANYYLNCGQFDKAIADCNEALRLDPKLAWAYNNRGIAYVGLRDFDRALTDYDRATELDPSYTFPYNNRAVIWLELGQYEKAVTECTRGLQLDPKYTVALVNRAKALARLGKLRLSIADLKLVAFSLDPEYARPRSNRIDTDPEKRFVEGFVASWTGEIRQHPEHPRVYVQRAIAHLAHNRLRAAITDLRTADRLITGAAHFEPYGGAVLQELAGASGLAASQDGNFLYATSPQAGTVVVFRIGELDLPGHVQTFQRPELVGAIHIALSPDQRWAAVAAFRSSALILCRRDRETGKLEISDIADKDMGWAVHVAFSPDGSNIYVADAGGSGNSSPNAGAIVTLRIDEEGKLQTLQRLVRPEFAGARGVVTGPAGHSVYLTSSTAGTLAALARNADGTLQIAQLFEDDKKGVQGLRGVMTAVISPDGQHLYTVSGRFSGDHAVSVFRRLQSGRLALVQELFGGPADMGAFRRGNRIAVSPDGSEVYASGTTPGCLACFQRDPASGKLSHIETRTQSELPDSLKGAADLVFSPDGELLFLAAERTISVWTRTLIGPRLTAAPDKR